MNSYFASVRVNDIKSFGKSKGGLAASEDHAKRLDNTSQSRVVNETQPIAWSKAGDENPLELVKAFKLHKAETGAVERNKCAMGMHLIVNVSPDWLGNGHDPDNPKVIALIENTVRWVESWQGEGAVFAYRYDLDEKGSGVVDVFSAPSRIQGRRGGKQTLTISPNMVKNELKAKWKTPNSGAAMQSDWAQWAQRHLDPTIQRGRPKEQTGRDHVHAELYKKFANQTRAEAEEANRKFIEQTEKWAAMEERIVRYEQRRWDWARQNSDDIVRFEKEAKENQARAKALLDEAIEKHRIAQDVLRSADSKEAAEYTKNDRLQAALDSIKKQLATVSNQLDQSQRKLSELEKTNRELAQENKRLSTLVQSWHSFYDLVKSVLQRLLPKEYSAVQTKIDQAWEVSPRNPKKIDNSTNGPTPG